MTQHHRPPRAAAIAPARPAGWQIGLAAGILGAAGILAAPAPAQESAPAEAIITSHGYSTFGDLHYPADYARLDYVNPDAPKGGEISIFALGTFDSMNPYAREGRAGALSTIMTESLLTGTADEVSAQYCLLCTSIEYPESEDWVIFHLNPEARFSDGTPVTAQDVVFSHYLLLDQGLPSYAETVRALIPTAEALDDLTVKFTFAPDVPRKNLINQAGGIPVWPQHWFEETGARLDESRLEVPPGSGPYMLESADVNQRITYVRNPDYWGRDLPINIGRNNFDRIRVEYFADTDAAFEAFKAGEYTFRQENSSLSWATRYDFPALDQGWVVRAELPNGNLPGAVGIVFNLRRPELQDIRVRQALALMYNFEWTNESLQYGLFDQRASFWQNSDLAAQGVPEGLERDYLEQVADLIDPAILTDQVTMPHTSDARAPVDRANLGRALALMEEAGWIPDEQGRLMRDGQRFTVEFMTDQPTFDRIFIPYVDSLNRLLGEGGAVYNRVDPAQYTDRQRNFDWDMIYSGYDTGLEEGIGLDQQFGSLGVGDIFNPAGYASAAVDRLIDIVVEAKTREEMEAGVRAIDRIMRRELFMVPTWYNPNYWVAYYDMFRHPDVLPPYTLGQLDFWWYDEAAGTALREAGALR
ncbi:MAG: ABC transporter substrate-binding protein [Rubellimicrobium sp.]|nr:ABC transporter substrate-binding protein [Rubellimicrobium sp.]